MDEGITATSWQATDMSGLSLQAAQLLEINLNEQGLSIQLSVGDKRARHVMVWIPAKEIERAFRLHIQRYWQDHGAETDGGLC